MVAIAALLPTNTPAPMIPPMEIITRWRARRDLESREEAGREASVAFKLVALVGRWRAPYACNAASAIEHPMVTMSILSHSSRSTSQCRIKTEAKERP